MIGTSGELRARMDDVVGDLSELFKSSNKKIAMLEQVIIRCQGVMTSKQKCIVFSEQACHDCDDFECGDNLSKKPSTPMLCKLVKKALKENDVGVIDTFIAWLFNTNNEAFMRQFNEITDLHRMTAVEAVHEYRVRAARVDFGAFMEYCFFDEVTRRPFKQQWFHDEWAKAWDEHDHVLIIAPQDHGKTSQIVGRVIWELGREHNLRIKIACAADGLAKERLFEIVQHIENNERVHEVFPDLKQDKNAEWSKHKIVIKRTARHRDASVEALGITATATGGRCDLLIADDVVDRRNALSFPKLRNSIKQAWKSDWTNLLEPESRIIYICTLWHKDDLSHELMENPAFHVLFYAIPDDFGAMWPEKWSSEFLRERFIEIGSIEFNRGFRNKVVDSDQ